MKPNIYNLGEFNGCKRSIFENAVQKFRWHQELNDEGIVINGYITPMIIENKGQLRYCLRQCFNHKVTKNFKERKKASSQDLIFYKYEDVHLLPKHFTTEPVFVNNGYVLISVAMKSIRIRYRKASNDPFEAIDTEPSKYYLILPGRTYYIISKQMVLLQEYRCLDVCPIEYLTEPSIIVVGSDIHEEKRLAEELSRNETNIATDAIQDFLCEFNNDLTENMLEPQAILEENLVPTEATISNENSNETRKSTIIKLFENFLNSLPEKDIESIPIPNVQKTSEAVISSSVPTFVNRQLVVKPFPHGPPSAEKCTSSTTTTTTINSGKYLEQHPSTNRIEGHLPSSFGPLRKECLPRYIQDSTVNALQRIACPQRNSCCSIKIPNQRLVSPSNNGDNVQCLHISNCYFVLPSDNF